MSPKAISSFMVPCTRRATRIVAGCCWIVAISVYPGAALADQNSEFFEFLWTECNGASGDFLTACGASGIGGGGSSPPNPSTLSNLGVTGAQNRSASIVTKEQRKLIEDQENSGSGAGSNDSGWGLLVAPQYSESDRKGSDLENGYDSELIGLVVGLDYAFSARLLAGATLGITRDDASFDGNAGNLATDSTSLTLYTTWAIDDLSAFDAYLVVAKADYDNKRNYAISDPVVYGTAESSSDSRQILIGLAYNQDWQLKNWQVGGFANIDYLKADIDSYSETDSLGFGLVYPEQEIDSLTSTIGARFNYFRRGAIPNFRLAWVHEYENDAREIDTRLVLSPMSVFSVETDNPDRDYLLGGFGVVGTLSGGAQWFADYEQYFAHDSLDNWAISAGILYIL